MAIPEQINGREHLELISDAVSVAHCPNVVPAPMWTPGLPTSRDPSGNPVSPPLTGCPAPPIHQARIGGRASYWHRDGGASFGP